MSAINTTNINVNYPVPGQDNDSQGFRDNFFNLRSALNTAKTEITTLQSAMTLWPDDTPIPTGYTDTGFFIWADDGSSTLRRFNIVQLA